MLRNVWVSSLDVNPANGHLSPWALALFSGDFEEAMSMLDRWNETQGDVFKLLERHETITLLIVGCRCLTNAPQQFHAMKREVENKGGHISDHKRKL